MFLKGLSALALSICAASGFKDTSPFFVFSTSELLLSSPRITSASSLARTLIAQLEKCPSDNYVIVSQPGVNVADYSNPHSAPHLKQMTSGEDKNIRSSLIITDMMGAIDADEFVRAVEDKCGAVLLRVDASTGSFSIVEDMKPRVVNLDFPALPLGTSRAAKLAENDAFLESFLDMLPSTKYTVIYTTSPTFPRHHLAEETELYEMDQTFASPAHMELRRDFSAHKRNVSNGNITLIDGSLFERYQFFGPGLFMGILVTLPLLMILYVAISGVSSLQVSYAAFDKEMGPAAQKKQS